MGELNTQECCYDGGDCKYLNESSVCQSCGHHMSDELVGNGFCDGVLLTPDCCFDLGDCNCPGCPFNENIIGNDLCDNDISQMEECCFDGGDCACVTITLENQCCSVLRSESQYCFPVMAVCPTCVYIHSVRFGDSKCNDYLNSVNCCFDGGDCINRTLGQATLSNYINAQ